jgi:hypothetical protein
MKYLKAISFPFKVLSVYLPLKGKQMWWVGTPEIVDDTITFKYPHLLKISSKLHASIF